MAPRQFWRLWALAAVALAVGVLGWPTDSTPELVGVRVAPALPAPPSPPSPADAQQDLDALAASTLWGPVAARAADAASAAAPEPAWHASGVYETPAGRRVLVHFDDKARPARQLAVGDKLPDGSVIVDIGHDRLQVRSAGTAPRWIAVNRGLPLPGQAPPGLSSPQPGSPK